jgi:hypothetical protein
MTTTTHLIIRLAGLLIAAASLPTLSQLHLAPVYGALPASANHQTLTTTTILASLLIGPRHIPPKVLQLALPIAILRPVPVPQILQAALPIARDAGVTLGPIILEATFFMPFLFVVVAQTHTTLLELWQRLVRSPSFSVKLFMPPTLFAALFTLQAWANTIIPMICATGHTLLSRRVLQLVLCDWPLIQSSMRGGPWWTLLGFLLALIGMVVSQTYGPKQFRHGWKVLAHGESVTGYISVLENTEIGYRLLRCDHSLLGGEWLLTEQRQRDEGWQVPEPVFGVFAMLEAVRLVRTPYSQGAAQKKDSETSALVM